MGIVKNVQRYINFDKDVSTSPDAIIPDIVKETKEKQAEIPSASRAKMIWSWNKTNLQIKPKHNSVFRRSEII